MEIKVISNQKDLPLTYWYKPFVDADPQAALQKFEKTYPWMVGTMPAPAYYLTGMKTLYVPVDYVRKLQEA